MYSKIASHSTAVVLHGLCRKLFYTSDVFYGKTFNVLDYYCFGIRLMLYASLSFDRFPPAATSFVLQQFAQYGSILKHVVSYTFDICYYKIARSE